MTWFNRWLLAYDTYVWVPFCWWLIKHPVSAVLAFAIALALIVGL